MRSTLHSPALAALALGGAFLVHSPTHGATVLFTQDFSSSSNVADYIGTGANQFDNIGTTGAAGFYTEAIVNDDLVLSTVSSPPAGSSSGEGFLRSTSYLQGFTALRVEFTLGLNNNAGSNNVFAGLEFGPNLPTSFSSNSGVLTRFVRLEFRRASNASLLLANNINGTVVNSLNLGANTLLGQVIDYQLILNDGASAISYLDPSGGISTIDPNSMSLFYNTGASWQVAFDNILVQAAGDLSQFRFTRNRTTVDPSTSATWDDLTISSLDAVPEPAAAGLTGGAAMLGLFLARRRRVG